DRDEERRERRQHREREKEETARGTATTPTPPSTQPTAADERSTSPAAAAAAAGGGAGEGTSPQPASAAPADEDREVPLVEGAVSVGGDNTVAPIKPVVAHGEESSVAGDRDGRNAWADVSDDEDVLPHPHQHRGESGTPQRRDGRGGGGGGRGPRPSLGRARYFERERCPPVPETYNGPYGLMLHNVPYKATKRDVEDFLRPCRANHIRLDVDARNPSKNIGRCYVQFDNRRDFELAWTHDGLEMFGREIRISLADEMKGAIGGRRDDRDRPGYSFTRRSSREDDYHRDSGYHRGYGGGDGDGGRRSDRDRDRGDMTPASGVSHGGRQPVMAAQGRVIEFLTSWEPSRYDKPSPVTVRVVRRSGLVVGEVHPYSMEAKVWWYIDLHHKVHGPFSSQQMHEWDKAYTFFDDAHVLFSLWCDLAQHPQPCPPHQQPLFAHGLYPKYSFFAENDPRGPAFTFPVSTIPLGIGAAGGGVGPPAQGGMGHHHVDDHGNGPYNAASAAIEAGSDRQLSQPMEPLAREVSLPSAASPPQPTATDEDGVGSVKPAAPDGSQKDGGIGVGAVVEHNQESPVVDGEVMETVPTETQQERVEETVQPPPVEPAKVEEGEVAEPAAPQEEEAPAEGQKEAEPVETHAEPAPVAEKEAAPVEEAKGKAAKEDTASSSRPQEASRVPSCTPGQPTSVITSRRVLKGSDLRSDRDEERRERRQHREREKEETARGTATTPTPPAPPAAVGEFACMTEPVVEAAEVVQKAKKENKKAEVPLGEGAVGAGGEAKKEMPVEEEAPQAQEPDGTPVGPHVEDTSPEHRHSPTKTKEEEAVAGQEAPVPMGQAEAAPAGRETPAGKTKVDREEAVMEPVREEPLVPAKQDTIAAECSAPPETSPSSSPVSAKEAEEWPAPVEKEGKPVSEEVKSDEGYEPDFEDQQEGQADRYCIEHTHTPARVVLSCLVLCVLPAPPPSAVGEFAGKTEPVVEAVKVVQEAKKENKKAEVPLGEGTVGAGGEAKKEMPVEEEAPQAQEPDGTPVGCDRQLSQPMEPLAREVSLPSAASPPQPTATDEDGVGSVKPAAPDGSQKDGGIGVGAVVEHNQESPVVDGEVMETVPTETQQERVEETVQPPPVEPAKVEEGEVAEPAAPQEEEAPAEGQKEAEPVETHAEPAPVAEKEAAPVEEAKGKAAKEDTASSSRPQEASRVPSRTPGQPTSVITSRRVLKGSDLRSDRDEERRERRQHREREKEETARGTATTPTPPDRYDEHDDRRRGGGGGGRGPRPSLGRARYFERKRCPPVPETYNGPYGLILDNIHYEATKRDVEVFLTPCRVDHMMLEADHRNPVKNLGRCYVQFDNRRDFELAWTYEGLMMLGRRIRISTADEMKYAVGGRLDPAAAIRCNDNNTTTSSTTRCRGRANGALLQRTPNGRGGRGGRGRAWPGRE
ncbi:unnamed protein product, partial [Vitrella brassicaformis CCMP3155]